jgi:hypothetical protein
MEGKRVKWDCMFCNWYSFNKDAWKRHLAERHGVYYTRWHEDRELPTAEEQFKKIYNMYVRKGKGIGNASEEKGGDGKRTSK